MADEKDCKPGFNSCDISDDAEKKVKDKVEEVAADGEAVCKPGYNSCSIDGEPVPETPEKESTGEKDCKPGFNSCDI